MFGIDSPFTGIIGIVHIILVIIALFDILSSGRSTGNKIIWGLIVFFFPLIGLILYWLLAREN
ncbi:hypothetical protein DLH72_03575 [Candidatus Gracilibacteria bacterium]|nr:MAG: hypothetical protein DLH72_03575 [Candidatus Gracilibacteria bacterium]